MQIIGHRIKKVSGQRHDVEEGTTLSGIKTNAEPTGIREGKSDDSKNKVLIVDWRLTSDYNLTNEKKLADLEIAGEIIIAMESKEFKKTMEDWKKNKRMEKDQLIPILQGILNVAQVEAIILARELNLPSPVQLIKIKEN